MLVALVVVAALLLRAHGLTESLWYDELWSTHVILGHVPSLVRVIGADIHPPLYSVLMFFWIRVFGDSEISVRMIPLICGLATIALAARLAIDYGCRAAAPVTALVIALSPAHIWYSQEARPYSLLLALTVASVLVFHRIRQTHARRWYLAYAAVALCMVFTDYFAASYVAAVTVVALSDRRARTPMLWIGLSIAALLAAFLAAKWQLGFLLTEAGYLRDFRVSDLWKLPAEWLIAGGVFGSPGSRGAAVRVSVLAAQIALMLLAARGLIAARAPRSELALLFLCLPLGLLTLDLIGARHVYIERSALTVLPFFAIAIGVGVASLRQTMWKGAAVALIAGFGTVILVNYYAKQDQWTVYKPNADWRAAAQALADAHARSGRPVVILATTPALELTYYNAEFGQTRLHDMAAAAQSGPRGGLRDRLKRLFALPNDPRRGQAGRIYETELADALVVHEVFDREQAPEIFLARNEYWLGPTDNLIDSVRADPRLTLEPFFSAKGIRLLRIRPNAAKQR